LVPFDLAQFGTWVAILVYAYAAGGTAAAGIVGFLLVSPAALLAPLAPSLCARLFGGRGLMAGYAAQALLYALTGLTMNLNAPPALVIALAAMSYIAYTTTLPLVTAALPGAAKDTRELTSGSLLIGWIEGFGFVAGPALAGLILLFAGPGLVYLVMAAGLVGSVLLVENAGCRNAMSHDAILSVPFSPRAGLKALAGEKDGAAVGAFMSVHYVILGAIDVLLVTLAFHLLHMGQAGLGLLTTVFGVGSVIGASVGLVLMSGQRLLRGLVVGAIAWGAGLTTITFLHGDAAVLLIVLAGIGRPLITVSGRLLLQRVAAEAALIPLFAVLEGISMAAIGVGLALMPPIIARVGDRESFIAVGLLLPVLLILLYRQFAALQRRGILPAELLLLIRSVPMFSPLSPLVVDRLARNLIPVSVEPGEVVARQGEHGRRFYIVASGRLTVDVDGHPVRTLGEGSYFGEIALLRDGIRTATVTADLPTYLYALDRAHFLPAVTGHPDSSAVVGDLVESLLANAGPGASRSRRRIAGDVD
jgi:CRP-like cAMP-binding protein